MTITARYSIGRAAAEGSSGSERVKLVRGGFLDFHTCSCCSNAILKVGATGTQQLHGDKLTGRLAGYDTLNPTRKITILITTIHHLVAADDLF